MTSRTTARFRKAYAELPDMVRERARAAYRLSDKTLIIPVYTSSRFTLDARSTRLASDSVTERLGS